MCTLLARHRMDYFCSTIIVANRDEFYQRESSEPQVLNEDPLIVGGRDEEKGGTWLGVTSDGVFLGITNQRSWGGVDPALRSRGLLVIDALKSGSVEGIRSSLAHVNPDEYNEFNVMFGDGREVWAGYGRKGQSEVELEQLGSADAHVLCNDRIGSTEFPKARTIRNKVRKLSRGTWPQVRDRLVDIVKSHELPPLEDVPEPPPNALFDHEFAHKLQSPCVHTPQYGTVSSAMIAIKPGRIVEYWASNGPLCQSELKDYKHLFESAGNASA